MSETLTREKFFTAGYGAACAGLARDHGEDDLAAYLLTDSGIPLEDFEACGLEAYDLDVIRKLFADNPQAGRRK